jgi:hypothetical protein
VATSVVLLPGVLVAAAGIPWRWALAPVWGSVAAGAAAGLIGAAVETYAGVRLAALPRALLWAGLAALLLWIGDTYLPGWHVPLWPGLAASAAVGVAEAILPADLIRQ